MNTIQCIGQYQHLSINFYFNSMNLATHILLFKLCMTVLDWKKLYRRQFTWRIIFYVYLYFMMMDMMNLIFFAIFSLVLFRRIEKVRTEVLVMLTNDWRNLIEPAYKKASYAVIGGYIYNFFSDI